MVQNAVNVIEDVPLGDFLVLVMLAEMLQRPAGSPELFRFLKLLCGFHLLVTFSRLQLPMKEPQSRADYAQLCATRLVGDADINGNVCATRGR